MPDQQPPTDSLRDLQDIKKIMERSSRFISLSGLSGVAAGVFALVACWFAYEIIGKYYKVYNASGQFSGAAFQQLKLNLLVLAAGLLAVALLAAFYFTWRRAKNSQVPLWNLTSRKLAWNMTLPLLTGALFILALLQHDDWVFIAPACLIFYGLALVNASKYTLSEIRYLGYFEIVLGLINTQFPGYGLYFWAAGFGVLHIVYGISMWLRYERN